MTEKQYRLNKWGTRLLKNNRPLFDWTNESDEIVDLLNKLNGKNEQLKHRIVELHEENKELKQFKKSVFALINEKITFVNECEKNHNDIGIPHEYYRGADEILNLLKKELVE